VVVQTSAAVLPAPAPVRVCALPPAPKSVPPAPRVSLTTPSICRLQLMLPSAPVLVAMNFTVTTQLPPPGSPRLSTGWLTLGVNAGPAWVALKAPAAAPAAPAGPGTPGGPAGPAAPCFPAGTCPRLKSLLSSERSFTVFVVTLLAGSLIAA
jgi:hypothetical protein